MKGQNNTFEYQDIVVSGAPLSESLLPVHWRRRAWSLCTGRHLYGILISYIGFLSRLAVGKLGFLNKRGVSSSHGGFSIELSRDSGHGRIIVEQGELILDNGQRTIQEIQLLEYPGTLVKSRSSSCLYIGIKVRIEGEPRGQPQPLRRRIRPLVASLLRSCIVK